MTSAVYAAHPTTRRRAVWVLGTQAASEISPSANVKGPSLRAWYTRATSRTSSSV